MRIAIARGNNINPFEMQSYAPMAARHELTGYASFMNKFEADGIGFPVKRLHTFEEYYRPLPSPIRSMTYGLSLRFGLNQRMFGLEKELADADIIHTAETYTGYSYQAARLKKDKNKTLVVTVWENIPFLSTHQFMGFDGVPVAGGLLRRALTNNDRIVSYVKEQADILMAVTGPAKTALMAEGVPEEKIRVQPVGIDTERFKPAPPDPQIRKQLGLADDDFVVLFIGRLEEEKGIYDLINAVKLMSSDPDMARVRAVMVGNGAEGERIKGLIGTYGIGNRVELVGSFPYEAVPRLYNAADVFILPSIPVPFWEEQFGMVLVEAMSSGVPVISTRSGSIPEVVGDAGVLIPPNDPSSIYEEIKKLYLDRSWLRELAGKGRKRALDVYRKEDVASCIEAVYKELL